MKVQYYIQLIILFFTSFFNLKSQTNEAVKLEISKDKLMQNPNCFFMDQSKQILLPADGGFMYSSFDNPDNNHGYNANENFVLTIKNQYQRKIFLRNHFFVCEKGDVLKIYNGEDTLSNLIKTIDGVTNENFLILSKNEYLTLHFKSNSFKTSKGFRFRLDNGPVIASNISNLAPLPSPMACASTPAADECVNAPLICDLSGYCGNTSGAYSAGNTSGLGGFCGSIENNSWLKFIASSTAASLAFTSSGCQDNSSGIQATIYASSNCSNFTSVSNCVSQGSSSGSFTITTNVNLVVGQTYYVMVDGYAGNVCNYSVTAQSGVALTPQITGPNQVCPGTSNIIGSSISAPSYTWSSTPPGTYPNSQNITVNPSVTTTYTLSIPGGGCSPSGATSVKTITVTSTLPPPNITAPNPSCLGSNITLTSLTNGGTYNWTGPNGFNSNSQSTTINNWTTANNGTYTLSIDYGGGCQTLPATININAVAAPVVNFVVVPSATICAGQSVTLTATGGSGANPYEWNWNILNTTASLQTCIIIPGVPAVPPFIPGTPSSTNCTNNPFNSLVPGIPSGSNGVFTPNANTQICAATNNAAGCRGSNCINITVLPSAGSITVSPTQTICPGQSATITAIGGTTYTWNPGGITTATAVVSPATTTTYTVSSPGCSSTQTQTTQVVVNGTPPNLGNVIGLGSVCPNQTGVTYSVNNVGGATYSWQVPPGASITSAPTNSNAITVNFGATAGSVIATASTACGSATSIVVVAVTPNPTITMPASTTVCPGQSVILTITGPGSYTWAPGSSLSSTTGSVVTASPSVTTIYSVSTDGCGSPVTGTVEIAVSGDPPNIGLINGPTTLCSNALSNLSYSVAFIPGTSYTWTAPPGANITSSPANTNSITMNMGSSSGSVIVTAANACGTATSIVTVNLAPTPTINVTPNQSICPGEFALLGAGGAATFTWMPGNLTTQTISVNPSSTTIYTVTGDNGVCLGTNTVQVNSASNPVLSISSGATVCPGSSATFTVGGATNYTWTPNIYLNNNNTASVISTPNASTNYTVIGANGSCQSNATVSIVVSNTVVVTASAASPTICPLSGTSLTASGATSYTWTPTLTLSSNTGAVVLATPAFSTTYTVIGSTGTCTNTAQVVVTPTTNPIITPASSPTICSGSSAGLSVSGANSYTWTPSPSLSATGIANPNASPNTTTTYSVSGSSLLGCVGSTVVTVNVIPTPTISITSAPSSASICAGQSITLNAFGAASYTWSPSASVSNITGSSTTATPNQSTIYTVIGSNGTAPNICTSSRTIQITVKPNTVVSISPRDSVCFGSSTLMYANGGNTYNWSPSNGVSNPNDSVTIVKPISTTIYTVTASVNGVCPGTATVEIVVNPLPSVNAGLDTTVNIDETITLFGTGNVPVGFTSADGSPMPCNFCPIVTVNPQNNTCYILTGTNGHGCTKTDEACVKVIKDWNVYIPNAFTPNGDIDNEVFIPVGYGVEEIKLWIFDRWGHEIFRSNDQIIGWDGTNKGKVCPQDVYIYQAEIKTMSGKKVKRTGHVTLLGKVR